MAACGIDFGTSNSMVAFAAPDRVVDLRIDVGHSPPETMPTLIFCTPENDWFYGTAAIREYVEHHTSGRFIQSIKRHLPSRSFTHTFLGGRRVALPEIVGAFLANLRRITESLSGEPVTQVVLGRPARFHEDQSRDELAESRLREAAVLAGFRDIHFRPEPIAAARAFEESLDRDVLCLVGDLGGGTTDFTLMRLGPSRLGQLNRDTDILGTSGINVAGDDFDAALVRLAVWPQLGYGSEYAPLGRALPLPTKLHLAMMRWHQLSFAATPENLRLLQTWMRTSTDSEGLRRLHHLMEWNLGFELFRSIEGCKRELSSNERASLSFHGEGVELRAEVTRRDFEAAILPLVDSIERCMNDVLRTAGIKDDMVDAVFLTGGTSLVPLVRSMFRARFSDRVLPGNAFTSVGHGLGVEARHRFSSHP